LEHQQPGLILTPPRAFVEREQVKFFLGIDGGGSRTRTFLVDESGEFTAWGEAGLSNPNHAAPEELVANLQHAIHIATGQAKLGLSGCVSVFAGIAGVTTEGGRQRLRESLAACGLGHARIAVDHDIRIALAGGLAGQSGIALIVGTGSSCYGRTADGRTWQTGGWEALISDEGSAFYLGREAIAAAARMADGRTADSPLRESVFQWLGIRRIADILPRIHDQGLARSEIAAFAPQVISLAAQADAAALEILDRGAALLAQMVAANHRMLQTGPLPDVVITGGLGTAEGPYRVRLESAIHALLPSAVVHEPILSPALGAALLAVEETGCSVSTTFLERLKQFTPP
jgi:N-acetylglucosamine kinase-like BadF-type ATPase